MIIARSCFRGLATRSTVVRCCMVGLGNAAGFQKSSIDAKAAAAKVVADKKKPSAGAKKAAGTSGAKKASGAAGAKKATAVLSGKAGASAVADLDSKPDVEDEQAAVAKAAEEAAAKAAEEAAAAAAAEEAAAAKAAEEAVAAEVRAKTNGKVVVRYNHYNKSYDVVDGKLNWEHVDDQYAISFVRRRAIEPL